MMTNNPPIDLDKLDALLETLTPHKGRIIWTAKGIGDRVGLSETYVRKYLVHIEGNPVRRTATNRLYAFEAELVEFWQRRRAA